MKNKRSPPRSAQNQIQNELASQAQHCLGDNNLRRKNLLETAFREAPRSWITKAYAVALIRPELESSGCSRRTLTEIDSLPCGFPNGESYTLCEKRLRFSWMQLVRTRALPARKMVFHRESPAKIQRSFP